ncbi:MAG: hypothetical protein E6K63_05130 [Nitrospirae bacterium]|nr:MAG: hypothetical protein E6K63_05130 [Nitrospirota bacterium]
MRVSIAGLFLVVFLSHGCMGRFSNIVDDDPITDGFRKSLPPPHARTVVWGGHPSATGTAVSWLQRQGLRIVERSKLQKVLDEQTIRLTHTSDDEAQVLRVGKLLGAEVVVFIDSPVTGGHQSSGGAYGNIAASGSATVYSTSIWVRGVDIESGEVLWSATARYPESFSNLDDMLVRLTCHALATAWGFRQVGEPETVLFPKDMCLAGSDSGR